MDQYSDIGNTYKNVAPKLLLRTAILVPNFLESIGDVSGKSCLDLACGSGQFTRLMKQAGAVKVVGVDVSEEMIKTAKEDKSPENKGIQYIVGDASGLDGIGQFDVVSAVFLLNYAKTKDELASMCRAIHKHTKPGGFFVNVNVNPDFPIQTDSRYGFTRTAPEPLNEGDELELTHYSNGEPGYSVKFFHWSKATYDDALNDAGFETEWLVPEIDKDSYKELGEEFWQLYKDEPGHSITICKRSK